LYELLSVILIHQFQPFSINIGLFSAEMIVQRCITNTDQFSSCNNRLTINCRLSRKV